MNSIKNKKIIILISITIIIIIIIAAIGYLFYYSKQLSVKVVNNSNDRLEINVFIDDYWSGWEDIDSNNEIVFSDTGNVKGQKHSIELTFRSPSGRLYDKEITSDEDVTFIIQDDYSINVTFN